jgi:glycolate oxidase FAD binding subunit
MSSAAIGTNIDEFCASVRLLVQPDRLHTSDLAELEIDGMAPDAAVEPATVGELQEVLSEAHMSGVTVIPIGGGAHRGIGNVPTSYDVALSLTRLNGVLAYEPADLTITVEPGLRLADLQATLGARGQFLPLDPPCDPLATVGGVLAVNASGPLRHAFGTARDWVIGTRVVHADGSISKSGGRVVKNVTGYDMHKLHIGALGTLGVIAEVTLKVAPLPPAESTVVITCRSAAHASDLVLAAHDAGLALYCAELLSPPASQAVVGRSAWCVVARVAGAKAAVDRSLREIKDASSSTGASLETCDTTTTWEAWSGALRPNLLSLRVSVLPSNVHDVVQVLDRRLAGAGALASTTVTAGIIRVKLRPARTAQAHTLVDAAREVASRYGGGVVVEAAPPLLKREIDVFGTLRADFAIMQRLKEEFDPRGTLSPGRFAGRL